MTPEIEEAIEEIKQTFPECSFEIVGDGQGGAYVIVEGLLLAGPYVQDVTWVGFRITHTYPYCDIYPHIVRGDLSRRDGKSLGEAMSVGAFQDRRGIQISRRSNGHNPATHTAALKLLKVMRWLNSRP